MNALPDLRPSPIAGQWYNADPRELAAEMNRYLALAKPPSLEGEVVSLIVPHAGHVYSGPVAAWAFKTVQGNAYDLVVIVAPMHRPYPQPLLTSSHSGYATPLGAIPLDAEAITDLDQQLQASLGVPLSRIARDTEHSLEIELPFLQCALSAEFKLLPVMVRDQDAETMQALADGLARVLKGKRALLVASSDLSHFYSARVAERLDAEILREIEAFSPEGLFAADRAGKGYACGLGPIAAVLWASRALGATSARVVQYATSGDITRDYTSVVGYGAAVTTRPA